MSDIDYTNESLSFASTNKDSNMTSSHKGNNFYNNFFRNKNSLKRQYDYNDLEENEKKTNINNIKIQSYIVNLENKNEKNIESSRINYNYYPKEYSSFNYYYKIYNGKNSLINKIINILNLKKENLKQYKSKIVSSNFLSYKQNKKVQKKENAKDKLNEKKNKSQQIIKSKTDNFSKNYWINNNGKKNANNINTNKKFDINKEIIS